MFGNSTLEIPVLIGMICVISLFGCFLLLVVPDYFLDYTENEKSFQATVQENSLRTRQFHIPVQAFFLVFVVNIVIGLILFLYYERGLDDIVLTTTTISFLWTCAFVDYKSHLIPNRVLLLSLVVRIGLLMVEAVLAPADISFVILSGIIASFALALAAILCRLIFPKSIGWGDVKLLIVMGLYLGMDKIWGALFMGFVTLFISCIYLLVTKKADRHSEVAFAPFLLVGTILGAILTGI